MDNSGFGVVQNFLLALKKIPYCVLILMMTKFIQSRLLNIGQVLLCTVMGLDAVLVHKHAKKTWPMSSHVHLSQYQ